MLEHTNRYTDIYRPTEGSPLPCNVLTTYAGKAKIRLPDPFDQGEVELLVDSNLVTLRDDDA